MKRVTLCGILILLVLTLPQFVSTAPGSGGAYVFKLKWGSSGSGNGQFNMPRGAAIDSDGNVYVADTSNHRIQKFGSSGNHLATWGSYGYGDGQFRTPWGLAVDSDGNIYVADTSNNRIQKLDSSGVMLGWWGLDNSYVTGWHDPGSGKIGYSGTGDGELWLPYDVTVDSEGNVYVVDSFNHRIQKFDSDGGFLGWVGRDYLGCSGWHNTGTGTRGFLGSGDGQFNWPRGIAVDLDGNVYVADTNNQRIQKYDSFGVFLGWLGFGNDGNTGWHNPGPDTRGVSGTGDGQFRSPWGVDVDSNGNVFVADTSNQRYQKFDSDGVFLGWWGFDYSNFTGWHPPGTLEIGRVGTGDGQFYNPYDVAVDLDDNVFVVDTFMRRIQKFDLVPPLGVKSPNGEEILIANTAREITWEPGVGNDFVSIEFSVDNGTNWEDIVVSTENDGSYDWTVPCNLSAECLMLISGLDDGFFDESDDVFSIESDTPPVITLNGLLEIVLECGIDLYEEPGATAEDGCGDDVHVDIGGDWVDTMTCDEYFITYDAIDASGQVADPKIRSVIVHDTTPPDPDVKPLLPVSGECSVEISIIPTATDICSGSITGTPSAPIIPTGQGTYICTKLGAHTITWTYDDGNGNFATQTQTVTVEDTVPPDPDVKPLPSILGECSATVTTAPTATDNCAGSILGTMSEELPLVFTEQGTHTVTWIYDDGNENITTQIQTITLEDKTPPVPDETTLPDLEGECSVTITTAPTATDNCAGSITGTTTDSLSYSKKGTYTVLWTYTDENENTTTQTQTVTVEDVTPPTIHLSDSTCVDVKKWVQANMLTVSATDNCSSDVEVIIDKVKILNRGGRRVWGRGVYKIIGNDIYIYPKGRDWSVRVTVTAADESGNTTTESISKPLLKCNRWSGKMARLIRLLYILMWKMHRCW